MKVSCEVVRDLLPLVAEGIASRESGDLAQAHMTECPACKGLYEQMKTPPHLAVAEKEKSGDAFRSIKKELRKRKTAAVLFFSLVLLLALVTVFVQLTSPRYIDYTKELITLSEEADGTVYATFSNEVTGYHAEVNWDVDFGMKIMQIEAWSTVWDKILGKGAQTVQISSPEKPVDAAVYCANEQEAVAIYGTLPYGSGMILLPRLALGYYAVLAVLLAAVLGILWVIFRKKAAAERILRYCALAPVSYLIGHVCVKGLTTISFSMVRDFYAILMLSAVAYAVLCLGIGMMRQWKRDRVNIQL